MSKLGKYSDVHLTVYKYAILEINSVFSAVEWMCNIKNNSHFKIDHIILKDFDGRSNEGNTSVQLSANYSCLEINNEIKSRHIDKISVSGEFKDRIVVIGIDLRDYAVSVTLNNKNADLISEIENILSLLK